MPSDQQFGLDNLTDRDDLVADRKERIADFVNVLQIDHVGAVHPHRFRCDCQNLVKQLQRLCYEQFPLPGDNFAVVVVCLHPKHVVQEQSNRPVVYFDEQTITEETRLVFGSRKTCYGGSLCEQYVGAVHVATLGYAVCFVEFVILKKKYSTKNKEYKR